MAVSVNFDEVSAIVSPALISSLRQAKYNTLRTEIVSICPFCNGGRKKDRSFYLSIPTSDKPRYLYNCFRASCATKGIVNQEFLRMLDCNTFEVNVQLNKLNSIRSKNKSYRDKLYKDVANFLSSNDALSIAKLNYLNNRLGLDLTFKDLKTLKIHTDMRALYRYNNLHFPADKVKYYNEIALHGLSFISTYNDFLVVRNVTGNKYVKRYSIIDMHEDDFDTDKLKCYSIPTKIDLLSNDPIEIILSEGTFDIISVYYNLEGGPENSFNKIFTSVSGSTYEKTISHFIRKYGLLNVIIKIYSDNGVQLRQFEDIYKRIRKYTVECDMYIYYNKKDKDFGVPMSQIQAEEIYIY